MKKDIDLIVAQLRQEKKTCETLDGLSLSEGRKNQIVEKRKAEVRRRYGYSMDGNIKI